MTGIKAIAFDVFGTVFDLSAVPRDEVRAYVKHVHQESWQPLKLPASWATLPAHPDAAEGIAKLRERFIVVTLSNGPLSLLMRLSKHNGISWDAIVPLEMYRIYKPDLRAYMYLPTLLGVERDEVCMVTANRTFGDLEGAAAVGMRAQLIRDGAENPKDILELAERLDAT